MYIYDFPYLFYKQDPEPSSIYELKHPQEKKKIFFKLGHLSAICKW